MQTESLVAPRVRRGTTGVMLAAGSALAFGTLAILAKEAYEDGARPVSLLATRFTAATLLLIGFHLITRRSLSVNRITALRLLALGGLGYALESALFFAALERAPASIVSLIFYSFPLWTTILGWATGLERFHPKVLLALVVSSLGVLMIFSLPGTDLTGPLLALAAAISVSVYFTLAQVVMRGVPPGTSATYTAAGAAIALVIVSALTRTGLPAAALPEAGALGLATMIAFVMLYAAMARIGAARASIAAMLEPVTTLVLAVLLLDERINTRIVFGAALIVSSLPVLATAERRDAPVPTPPSDAS